MTYASVILDIPTQALDSAYTYALSADLAHAQIGCAVLVPFGGRKAIGYVVGLSEKVSENVKSLKSIEAVLSESYFEEAGAELAFYLSERYIAPALIVRALAAAPRSNSEDEAHGRCVGGALSEGPTSR